MTARTKSADIAGLTGWLAVTLAAAGIGAVASSSAPEFYAQLSLPDWAPPAAVFGPVWTVLYVLMAVAAWLVWRGRGFDGARAALGLYLAQLAANALWSWLFFSWRLGAFAFIEIIVLLALIAVTVVAFWRARPLAGLLLLPYTAWVAYASFLTFSIWQRNPQTLA